MPDAPDNKAPEKKPNPWPEPRWLEANESPFGIRAYDCRRLTLVGTIGTTSQEEAQKWIRLTGGEGIEFRGVAIKDALRVPCELTYRDWGEPRDGRYYRPRQMEEIWCIDFYDGCFQFILALESRLVYRAYVSPTDAERLVITQVEVHAEEAKFGPEHALDAVDYLMKSHLFRNVTPHPFPPHFRERPESDLLGYSLFEYGRRGLFGTFEPTRTLQGYPWDAEKVLNHGLSRKTSESGQTPDENVRPEEG